MSENEDQGWPRHYMDRKRAKEQQLPQNSSTVPMPKVTPPKDVQEPHVYGFRLGSLRYHEGKIFVAPNDLAPLSDAIEVQTIEDIKKIFTIRSLKEKQ